MKRSPNKGASPQERAKERQARTQERRQERAENRINNAGWQVNLVIGGLFAAGGLSGKVTLVGTDSSLALLAVGGGLLVWGGLAWWQSER